MDLDTAQALRQPEVQVRIDRQKASDLGVRVDTVAAALRTHGRRARRWASTARRGEQYDIRLRLEEGDRKDASGLPALMVPAAGGALVKLSNVTSLGVGDEPGPDRALRAGALDHDHLEPLSTSPWPRPSARPTPRWPPSGCRPSTASSPAAAASSCRSRCANFLIAFVLSLAFIYIVLAAQFESFVHPLTIMVSMFLSIPFGLLTLMLGGGRP